MVRISNITYNTQEKVLKKVPFLAKSVNSFAYIKYFAYLCIIIDKNNTYG